MIPVWTQYSHLNFEQFIDTISPVLNDQQINYLRNKDSEIDCLVEHMLYTDKGHLLEVESIQDELNDRLADIDYLEIELRDCRKILRDQEKLIETLNDQLQLIENKGK